ncbi:hypothetical protein FA13DRAFT_1752385 [Coprinellus micaceus]|uniref:CENP-V/GFA domain-containing protein n=1 Tax=Coprinellus micaceus TaxID=71717 RepID=A0A4Y7TUR6_COPMI|nr:hypothetical protein FA13DRAFT_1752385 [Coprinellus micaceus]
MSSNLYHSLNLLPGKDPAPRGQKRSFPGSCYCHEIEYLIELGNPEQGARTSICYCANCRIRKYILYSGLVLRSAFRVIKGETKKRISDNGSGTRLHREFCEICGGGILEYGESAGDKVYITYGSLEDPTELPPRGGFFCKHRESWISWMPEVPGTFQKKEVKN